MHTPKTRMQGSKALCLEQLYQLRGQHWSHCVHLKQGPGEHWENNTYKTKININQQ